MSTKHHHLTLISEKDIHANEKLESLSLPKSCDESVEWYNQMRKDFTSFEIPFAPEKGEHFLLIDVDRYFAVSVNGVFIQTYLMWLVDENRNCQDMGVKNKNIRLGNSLRVFIMRNGEIREEDEVKWIQRKMKSVIKTLNQTIMVVGEQDVKNYYSGSLRFCFQMKNCAYDHPSELISIKDSTYYSGDIVAICTETTQLEHAIILKHGVVLTNVGNNFVISTTLQQLCKVYPRCIKDKVAIVQGKYFASKLKK